MQATTQLTSGQIPINSVASVVAASMISAAGSAVFLILPLVLEGAAEALGLDDEQDGLVAASYFSGFLLVCLSAVFWIRRFNWQRVAARGFLLLCGGLLGGSYADSYGMLLVTMAISGVGAGIVFGLAICVISDTRNPDRNFGFKLLTEQAVGAALLFLLPLYITPTWGFYGLMVSVAILLGLLGLAIPWLPARGTREAGIEPSGDTSLPAWIALIALMIYFAGLSGLWAFVERLATDHAITAEVIGQALSAGVIGGGVGALMAGVLGDRFGRVLPLVFSTLVLGGVLAIYAGPLAGLSFNPGTMLFSGVWSFGLAYQMGVVVILDRRGNLAVLIASFLSLGVIIGPALAGMLIRGDDYEHLFRFTGGAMLIGLLLFLLLLSRKRQRLLCSSPT